ncbi:hypothetical protein CDAR_432181 [Caerostris darwini]|uniref:Uncharacterized protein n=1 Tax=Caerostris darwini TaxID=1538125 RepID=A0AAV4U2X1_9ARAC|nr:hypothetical protein CDAR_432181 [Caerostris darwini]
MYHPQRFRIGGRLVGKENCNLFAGPDPCSTLGQVRASETPACPRKRAIRQTRAHCRGKAMVFECWRFLGGLWITMPHAHCSCDLMPLSVELIASFFLFLSFRNRS